MSQKLYVRLGEEERAALEKMTRNGVGKAREITCAGLRALALLRVAELSARCQSA